MKVSLQGYFTKGLGLALVALSFTLIVYVVIKCLPGRAERKPSLKAVFILWYGLTLEAVSLFKSADVLYSSVRVCNVQPFAWIGDCFSAGIAVLWQVILNFLMYVPLGAICADFCKRKKRSYLWVPLMIIGVSAANELIQYILGLGIADIDDLLANTFGGLWGCALYGLWSRLRHKAKPYTGAAVFSGLPVVLACAALIFYSAKPYGYLQSDFNFEGNQVESADCAAIEGALPDTAAVYKAPKLGTAQLESGAQAVFSALGQEIDLDSCNPYDTVAVYRGEIQQYYIWYWNDGTFALHTSERGIELAETGFSPDEQMLEIIRKAGTDIPAASEFEEQTSGETTEYRLNYDFAEQGGHSYVGSISWEMKGDVLYELEYDVLELDAVSSAPAKDSAAVQKQIERGHFSSDELTEKAVDELICMSCDLQYVTDSKGFYHPVYVIACLADGQKAEITLGAI